MRSGRASQEKSRTHSFTWSTFTLRRDEENNEILPWRNNWKTTRQRRIVVVVVWGMHLSAPYSHGRRQKAAAEKAQTVWESQLWLMSLVFLLSETVLGGRGGWRAGAVSAAGATSSTAPASRPPTTPCAAGARLPAAQTLSCSAKLLQKKKTEPLSHTYFYVYKNFRGFSYQSCSFWATQY